MKKIFYIARNELYSLFYSPIAWILMIIFLVLTSVDYINTTDGFLGMFERGGPLLAFCNNLTSEITFTDGGINGYFVRVIDNLYIFFPLITMGLISREIGSGTIKLLYSSPVRIREMVLGKYLAILSFTLCLIVLLSITLVALCLSITNPDVSLLVASIFGMFLVLSAYAAIGLFVSSLTSYQIVAAIITLAIFALFKEIGSLWQDINIIRGITYYLNLKEKSANLIAGLFNLRDFTYFMIFISVFLLFTIIKIKSGTESISNFKKALRYIAVVAIAFVFGYITNKPEINIYYDVTRDKMNTIAPATQAALARLNDGDLKITAYSNLLSMNWGYYFAPGRQNYIARHIFEPYIRFKPDIQIKFVYYYNIDSSDWHYNINPGKTLKEIAGKEAKTYRVRFDNFLSPEEVSKQADVRSEENRNFFVLEYKGKKAILRTFDDPQYWPTENEFAASINRLVGKPPMVAFISGEMERSPFSRRERDYCSIAAAISGRYSLINQGFDFDTVPLKNREIPSGIAALVIADPRSSFDSGSLAKIDRYIDGGGNLLLAGEPDKTTITKPLFDKLGLTLKEGVLVQPSDLYPANQLFAYLTDTAKNISPYFKRMIKEDFKYYGDSLFRVAMSGTSAMEYQEKNGFKVEPLLYTDKQLSWNRLAPIFGDSLQTKVPKLQSDQYGSFITMVRMNRKIDGKDQRIIVASDADFLTNRQMNTARFNYAFGFFGFSYFTYGTFPALALRPESTDNAFKITAAAIAPQKIALYWAIPSLIAIIATIILIRRKRK